MNDDQKPEETQPVQPGPGGADEKPPTGSTTESGMVGDEVADHAPVEDQQAAEDRAFDEHPDVVAAAAAPGLAGAGSGDGGSSRWAGWASGPRRGIAAGAVAVLLLGGLGVGGVAVASALDGDDGDGDRSARGYDGRDGNRERDDDGDDGGDDQDLTAGQLAELAAAVDTAYPDAVVEALSGSADGTYWVRIETTDGQDLTLELDEDFELLVDPDEDDDAADGSTDEETRS